VIDTLVGAGADLDVNLEVDGTNLTGGVIEWVLADSNGDKKAGTAVTDDGANLFHQGDLIDVEVAMNTASTAGLMGIYAEVLAQPGL